VGDELCSQLAVLREQAPIYFFTPGGFWIVTGYDECRAVLSADAAEIAYSKRMDRRSPDWRNHTATVHLSQWFGHWDGEAHRAIRKLLGQYFNPRAVDKLAPDVESLIPDVVADFKSSGGGHFREEVAFRVTARITSFLLGVPEGDYDRLIPQIHGVMSGFEFGLTDEQWSFADDSASAMRDYWRTEVRKRTANPCGTDLISELVRRQLFDQEQTAIIAENLLGASFETTASSSTIAMYALLRHPNQLARARESEAARAAIPDEVLRMYPTAPFVERLGTAPIDVGGVTIPAGAPIVIALAAANRDPRHFDDPERFDLDRAAAGAIPFAQGSRHVCIGMHLARRAITTLFEQMLAQCERIELVEPAPHFTGLGLRMLDRLELRVG
jgi:cytochrome P450